MAQNCERVSRVYTEENKNTYKQSFWEMYGYRLEWTKLIQGMRVYVYALLTYWSCNSKKKQIF